MPETDPLVPPEEAALIYQLLTCTPPDDDTGQIVRAALLGRRPGLKEFSHLTDAIRKGSRRPPAMRLCAVWALGVAHLAPAQRALASEALIECARGRATMGSGRTRLWLQLAAAGSAIAAAVIFFTPPRLVSLAAIACCFAAIVVIVSGMAREQAAFNRQIRIRALESLARLGTVEHIGNVALIAQESPLLEDGSVQGAAIGAFESLASLLPNDAWIREDGATGRTICGMFATGDSRSALAALEAIERLGSGNELEDVYNVAVSPAREIAVRKRARDLIPVLRARYKMRMAETTLLRPAPVDNLGLLRPARSAEPDPRTLLRVAEAGKSGDVHA